MRSDHDRGRLEQAMRAHAGRPCSLCNQPNASYVCVFFPRDDLVEQFGGRPGTGRAVVYTLCTRCKHLPDAARNDLVETAMRRTFAAQRN
jgi:hypothetical protein